MVVMARRTTELIVGHVWAEMTDAPGAKSGFVLCKRDHFSSGQQHLAHDFQWGLTVSPSQSAGVPLRVRSAMAPRYAGDDTSFSIDLCPADQITSRTLPERCGYSTLARACDASDSKGACADWEGRTVRRLFSHEQVPMNKSP